MSTQNTLYSEYHRDDAIFMCTIEGYPGTTIGCYLEETYTYSDLPDTDIKILNTKEVRDSDIYLKTAIPKTFVPLRLLSVRFHTFNNHNLARRLIELRDSYYPELHI